MPLPSLPPRSPGEVARATATVNAVGSCCGHAFGVHAPDGCRLCQLQGGGCSGWRISEDPWAAEHVDQRRCATPGCGHPPHSHLQGAAVSGDPAGGCIADAFGCRCSAWTYEPDGPTSGAVDRVASGMARAIGAATDDADTLRRVGAVLLEHRTDVEAVLAAGEPAGGALSDALEALRRLLMDRGQDCDPWKEPCSCSTAHARRLLAAHGIQVA